METILKIEELKDVRLEKERWGTYDGFAVSTDKQVIKLLIDNGQDCCEQWGYFMSEDDFEKFVGAELIEISITDTALNTKKYNEQIEYGLDDGGVMFVNINTTKGLLQFTAFNAHNGYYGHKAIVISEQLNHEEYL